MGQQADDAVFDQARKAAKLARLRKENAEKLRDLKGAIFGKYLTKVPLLRMERYLDYPMHTSQAKPYIAKAKIEGSKQEQAPERIVGQKLVGQMIPKLITDDMKSAVLENEKDMKSSE